MNEKLALRVLSDIMGWDDATCDREFAWLSLMSRIKFDGYRGFLAGARFLESLADWLQQFEKGPERETAYTFVRSCLVYVGPHEIQHLVDLVYPNCIEPTLLRAVATQLGILPSKVWSRREAVQRFNDLKRRSLFLGLSDGARIDTFRRLNEGRIINDQVAATIELDASKWTSMLSKLQREQGNATQFEFLFLIDDFVGSGTTLLRREDDEWDGKLERLWRILKKDALLARLLSANYRVVVHHYISSHQAFESIPRLNSEVSAARPDDWFQNISFSYGLHLPDALRLDPSRCPDFGPLVEKYYDPAIETPSIKKGKKDARWGFAGCGLPLILEHNTPNNSIALLWAETAGDGAHAMRPLFRRRQRFSV